MKVGVIFYHKNILSIYKKEWILLCVNSIIKQTYSDFKIYEINYGEDDFKINDIYKTDGFEHDFYQERFDNHAQAMNFLLEKTMDDDCDIVFNTNMDDLYLKERFEIQIDKIKEGYDIVSSNIDYIDIKNKYLKSIKLDNLDIEKELNNNHNVIAHPCVAYSRNFLLKNRYIDTDIPYEDLNIWKRTIKNYKFYICEEFLLIYRIHNNQVSKEKKEIEKKEIIKPNNNFFTQKDICACGEKINRQRFNFCQKCNRIY